ISEPRGRFAVQKLCSEPRSDFRKRSRDPLEEKPRRSRKKTADGLGWRPSHLHWPFHYRLHVLGSERRRWRHLSHCLWAGHCWYRQNHPCPRGPEIECDGVGPAPGLSVQTARKGPHPLKSLPRERDRKSTRLNSSHSQ